MPVRPEPWWRPEPLGSLESSSLKLPLLLLLSVLWWLLHCCSGVVVDDGGWVGWWIETVLVRVRCKRCVLMGEGCAIVCIEGY